MIDVEWMVVNPDYASEVIRLVRVTGHAELIEIAARIEEVHPLLKIEKNQTVPQQEEPISRHKYLHTLR